MTEAASGESFRAAAARAAALLAALLALSASLGERLAGRGSPPAPPAAARALPALDAMPLASGTAVLVVAPRSTGEAGATALLYELASRRPDLRFSAPETWPPAEPVLHVLTLGDVSPPSGARRTWRSGVAALWTVERE